MPYEETKHKIDLIRNQIAAHGKLDDNQLRKINYKFRLEWNYNSNSMEGNTLTVAETRSVMVGNLDVHQKPINDVLEMKGHDEVVSDILRIGKGDLRLSESRIKQIHTAIIHESDEIRKNQIGKWKEQPNEIINNKGEKYSFIAPDEVPDKIHDLLNRTNAALDAFFGNKKNAPHPLDIAFQFHLEFLGIHPFHDGNGRVSRILTNLILISLGYPPFWINSQERQVYYNYISDIQGYGGDKTLLDDFLANLVLRSQQLVLDVVEGKDIEQEDDLDKEIALWKSKFEKTEKLISKTNFNASYLYLNFFNKIIDLSINKLSQFDDLFTEKNISTAVNNDEIFSVKQLKDKFEEIFNAPDDDYMIYELSEINSLQLNVSYYGFKNDGLNTFNAFSIIEINFDQYKYDICIGQKSSSNNSLLTKLYSEELTEVEIKTIVKTVVSKLFEDIKSSIKNN